jgi:ubiquitin C
MIFVRIPAGKLIQVQTHPDDSVATIKGLISDQEGIPPQLQRLVYQTKELKDDAKLSDLSIYHESTLNLVLSLRGGMEVIVLSESGMTYTIPARSTDSLCDLRRRLVAFHSFSISTCLFVHEGKLLEEEALMTLADYGFSAVTVLNLQKRPAFEVSMKTLTGETYPEMLTGSETIAEVRAMISARQNIPLEQIRVTALGKNLCDEVPVSAYGIGPGTKIYILLRLRNN